MISAFSDQFIYYTIPTLSFQKRFLAQEIWKLKSNCVCSLQEKIVPVSWQNVHRFRFPVIFFFIVLREIPFTRLFTILHIGLCNKRALKKIYLVVLSIGYNL